ncbi:MAG: ATP-binding protein [Candidatus Omnitrophota bacterium]
MSRTIMSLFGRGSQKDKSVHQLLSESQEQYRQLVEDANSIILRMDVNGNLTFFNKFAQQFFGYEESQILGKSVIGTIVPLVDSAGADLQRMIRDIFIHPENYVNNENENITSSGKRVCIAWTNRPLLDKDGQFKEVLCIGNDITKLKDAEDQMLKAKEAAEGASKAKSAFLANMSHELRAPINSVIGFAELLKDEVTGSLNDKQKEGVGYILESSRHLLSLINDILDLSKAEAGKMSLELSEFNLKDLIKKSFVFIAEAAFKRRASLSCDIKDDIGVIQADERKVKQIIFNLLSNAVKFTPEGGKVGVEAVKIDNNQIQICVWDTGIGIEEKDSSKVFSEFEQIDNEYSRKYAGSGLGMPLSKKLVELHGGKLWFTSAGKDKGSRFYFTLPRVAERR